VDVVVVGGGFAGLSAAWEVVRAGRSVLVLEAQDHVGGRARNLEIAGGEVSERGATFAGPTQNEILALAKEMGVETFPTFAQGENVYYADGERTRYSDTGPLGTELSLLFVLFYIAASGDEQHPGTFERNFNTRDGAQMFRFRGGSQRIAIELARRLGSRVLLRKPVRRIDQDAGGVRVHCDRLTVTARRAIVTAPPAMAARIEYVPPVRIERDQLTQSLRQGNLTKVTAVYDRPFWRDEGLNGTALSLNGPVNVAYDDSPEDGSPGVLFGFVGGDEARGFYGRPAAERRDAALGSLANYFGPKAREATQYFESTWPGNRWHRGGPVGIAGPGALVAHGHALKEPVGRIHWAGTETSSYWAGYMDGAVRSGKRAAAELLGAL